MRDEIDYTKKLLWWQEGLLMAVTLMPAACYAVTAYVHFLY